MTRNADIILAAALMDNIVYADGSRRSDIPGGAGLYALAGAALFSNKAVLVTGTGRDLQSTFGPWLDRNCLTTLGLRFSDDHAPRNVMRYLDEQTRTELPVFGEAHFVRLEPNAADLERMIGGARSVFIFRNVEGGFWSDVQRLIDKHNPITLWEIARDACSPGNRQRIEELALRVGALSINVEEAALVYGTSDLPTLLARFRNISLPIVFLRAGALGSFVVAGGEVQAVPSLPGDPVDVTGGGNAFGGGALVGIAEGRHPVECAFMGTAAARLAISQHGPPESGQTKTRERAQKLIEQLATSLEQ